VTSPQAGSHPPRTAPGAASDPFADVAALPGVADAVTGARDAVDRLLGHRVMRRRAGEVAAEAALRGARASAALEGADWTLDDVRAFDAASSADGAGVVHGALRVLAEVAPLGRTVDASLRHAVARLHVLAASDLEPGDTLGRPRDAASSPDDPLVLGPAPDPVQVAARLDALADLVARPTRAPALVVGAVVHGELLALRPFATGNGLVARAAQRLVLHSRGLDTRGATAPEVGHAEDRHAYVTALAGYVAASPEGVATWVTHCAGAVRLGARDGLAVCEALQRG
jgi:Fic family protein